MESCVNLGGKEGRTNIRISAEPGIELGTFWSEGRDLTNCANHARPLHIQVFIKIRQLKVENLWIIDVCNRLS